MLASDVGRVWLAGAGAVVFCLQFDRIALQQNPDPDLDPDRSTPLGFCGILFNLLIFIAQRAGWYVITLAIRVWYFKLNN